MERLLLIVAIAILSSCQIANIIPADKYIEPEPIALNQEQTPYSDVWERIAKSSSIQNQQIDDLTLKYINIYLENPAQFNKLLLKGQYFIYFVLEQLELYNLPPELALLPYIESNYDPFSISSSGAMGLWQFMPATARIYGLQDTWWFEQRHDPLISTKAAVRYLASVSYTHLTLPTSDLV